MKNTIIIDAKNGCTCDLVSIVDDGANSLFLEIHVDVSENPILEIDDLDVEINKNVFLYEIDSSYWVGTGTLQFRILDYSHTGNYFNISKIDDLTGNVYLTQVDNFNYKLAKPEKSETDLIKEALDSILNPVQILDTGYLENGETTFECNWSDYKYLLIQVGNYGNIYESHLFTYDYFKTTMYGNRAIICVPYNTTGGYWGTDVYKSDDTHVVVKTGASASNYLRCRIYGIGKRVT